MEKIYLNGAEIKRINSLDIRINESEKIVDFPLSNKGELNIILEPNYLWKRKQITGIPKRVEVLPW